MTGNKAWGGSVMLGAKLCWETLGPGILADVALTYTPYFNIAEDHVHPFMPAIFPNGSGFFQQDKAPCQTTKMHRNGSGITAECSSVYLVSKFRTA